MRDLRPDEPMQDIWIDIREVQDIYLHNADMK